MQKTASAMHELKVLTDRTWYKSAVVYQLHVRAFADSNDDGIGDFAGLTAKLDYLQDLGVTALWLLPFYPSPLHDDGYDIADYLNVHSSYGDLRAFRTFLQAAHARGLRVITELVLNHTSDQHPWFQRARRARPDSPERDYYVWSDTPERYADARIIFQDFESSNWSWDPVAKAYYWHRFYSHQPDLNFENPQVQRAMFQAVDYWLRLGVDGLRLDAVPYLFEREGTNCENLPETHEFLKRLRRHVDERFAGRMLLAEANQWPEDAVAYFGNGDECHAAFHFPIMPRLFMAIQLEDRFPVLDILQETPPIPDDCQWFLFLRNHDELTLEMVTDEERDYMYRVYARDRQARINLGIRRRLAPLLGNHRPKIELMNGLLCSLPGTPVIYYGDEIGMGDNIYLGDRNGVRTPMQWSTDRNAGFSRANPQRLYSPLIMDFEYLYETVNVETQQRNPHSLLWWMRRLIAVRQAKPALALGKLEWLTPANSKVLAFTRELGDDAVLVVANLSRFAQFAQLDLSRFAGRSVVELFGQQMFPSPDAQTPYPLTLAGHSFYWFALEKPAVAVIDSHEALPRIPFNTHWTETLTGKSKRHFEQAVARWLPRQSWYALTTRTIQSVKLVEQIVVGKTPQDKSLMLAGVQVEYLEGEPESYLLPLTAAADAEAAGILKSAPESALAEIENSTTRRVSVLLDATLHANLLAPLVELVTRGRKLKGQHGDLCGELLALAPDAPADVPLVASKLARGDKSATSFVFGDQFQLKLFHRLHSGPHPEMEISRFLMDPKHAFSHTLPVLGKLEYRRTHDEETVVGILMRHLPHTTTGRQNAADTLGRMVERVLTERPEAIMEVPIGSVGDLWTQTEAAVPAVVLELLSSQLDWSTLLGTRTAELHQKLASERDRPDFAPERYTQLYQRSLYSWWRKLTLQTFEQLQTAAPSLSPHHQATIRTIASRAKPILEKFRAGLGQKTSLERIRCHGHLDLEHVLCAGNDALFVDFAADAQRLAFSRRIKACVLYDLASLVISYQTTAEAWFAAMSGGNPSRDVIRFARQALDLWRLWMGSAFLRAYQANLSRRDLLPQPQASLAASWKAYLLERTLSDIREAIETRSDRLLILLPILLDISTPG